MPQFKSLLKTHMYKAALTTEFDSFVLPRFFLFVLIIFSVVLIFIFAAVIPVFPLDSTMLKHDV